MAITIREVANKLNLSITTVSRAIDGYDDVAKETRELVLRTASEMGYAPNRAARQLRRMKTDTIGFILPASAQRMAEPFFMEFIAGLGDELAVHNYDLLVANASSDIDELNMYSRWVDGKKVDGLILNRICMDDWRISYLLDRKLPFASLERSNDSALYPHLQVDASQGYTQLLEQLHKKGFQKPAYIGGPIDLVNHINRQNWISKAAAQLGMELKPELTRSADMTSAGGYQTAKDLFQSGNPPDAILCINDETAFGVMHAAHECGFTVGKDIAVAGFDGTLESLHTQPALTTLDIPVYEIARELVRMVLRALNGNGTNDNQKIVYPKLLIRDSTG